ncbi:kinase-like protein, partial [Hymenopellis radicata]
FEWTRGVSIACGTYSQVSFALKASTREVMVVKQVEIPPDREQSMQHRTLRMIKHIYETLQDAEHPNVVRCLGLELMAYLFLEYVSRASIHDLVKKNGTFGDTQLTRFVLGRVVDGVAFLHSQGVVHGDLKAENVLVEQNGRCKITCFGVSRSIDNLAWTKPSLYLDPEAMSLEWPGVVDVRGIGCIACEMWADREDWYEVLSVEGIFELAKDFGTKCFVVGPQQRTSAAELRPHSYLDIDPSYMYQGFG